THRRRRGQRCPPPCWPRKCVGGCPAATRGGGATMARQKISRNDPCPCGSGKKFKHCCIGKGIDCQARRAAPARRLPLAPRPSMPSLSGIAALRPHRVADVRLKELARATPTRATRKELVVVLADRTPGADGLRTCRRGRGAGALPDEAACYLADHAIQWMQPEGPPPEEDDRPDDDEALDRQTVEVPRRY